VSYVSQGFSNFSVSRFLITFRNEKTFRDRGSGFVVSGVKAVFKGARELCLEWKNLIMELTNRCLKLHVFRFVQTMTLKKI